MTVPHGTYQVWHRDSDEFKHVADVTTGSLSAVSLAELTAEPGTYGVMTFNKERQSHLGDVVVPPDGQAFAIEMGKDRERFQPIDFMPRLEVSREPPEQEMEL